MADAGALNPSHPHLVELLALDQGARVALVETISAKGFEPGCWIRVDDCELIATPEVRSLVVDGVERLERLPPNSVSGIAEFDDEHAWVPPDDGDPAWIIVSQSCDLIRDVR